MRIRFSSAVVFLVAESPRCSKSCRVKKKSRIPSSRKVPAILEGLEEVKGRGVPEWLQFDAEGMSAKVGSIPTREQINLPVQEQLIVELYSK